MELEELEQAASVLMNPFNSNRDLIKTAENCFVNFAKSKLTIPQCFHILENSRNELVLFETVKMMKNILIYEWRNLNEGDKLQLRQKLLDHVINNQQIHSSVCERILQIVSIMVKRKFIEDGGDQLKELMSCIKQMIFESQEIRHQQISCAIMRSILQEMTNTVKSEDVVLSFEEHFRCKKMFETRELPALFSMILEALDRLLPTLDISNPSHFIIMDSTLKITELVLSWSWITALIPKRIVKAFENLNNIKSSPSLRLSVMWQPIMLNRKTLEIFFIIYWRVRDHGSLQLRAMNCLIQMSTLSGPIFQQPNSSFNYFKNYLELLLMMLKNIDNDEREAFGLTMIIRKLLCLHVKSELLKLEDNLVKEFLEIMLMLTIKYIKNSVTENQSDTIYTDASRNMLEAYLDVINLADSKFGDDVKHHAKLIFQKFVECHVNGVHNISSEEVNEAEESEREAYKEQLIIVGFLGRLDVNSALSFVANLLEIKLSEMCNVLGNPQSAVKVFEAISWILMCSGHVLCMESVGEKPLVPKEINQLSQKLYDEGKVDSQNTIAYLQSSVTLQSTVDFTKCDPALRVFGLVLRLCEMENRALEGGFTEWSPLVSTLLMWFIGTFTNSYLYLDTAYYSPLSTVYSELLVPNDTSSWCMEYILRKIAFNLYKYTHELDVVEESIRIFLEVVNVRNQKLQHILELPSFQSIIQMRDVQLDSKVKRSVYKGLILATGAFPNIEQRHECLRHLLEPIGKNFDVLLLDTQRMNIHDTGVRERLIVLLDELTGVAQGISGQTFPFIYQLMRDRFHYLPNLMLLWRNYLDIQCAILKVFIEMATIQMTTSNAAEMARDFYEVCNLIMKTYLEQQKDRLEKTYSEDEEEPEDILMVIELFKKLTIQYIFEPEPVMIMNLGSHILMSLMPKMYPILQRFPEIAVSYYKSLNCFVELLVCNNQLHNLSVDLINHVLYTIKIGLTSFSYPEIQGHSLDLLTTMGDALIQDTENQLDTLRSLTVEPFGKLLFEVIVTLDLHNENKNDCFSAIYTLCCASTEPNGNNFCHETVKALNERQTGQLTYAQTGIAPEVEALQAFSFQQHSREQKMAFIDLLDKFISSICFLYHN